MERELSVFWHSLLVVAHKCKRGGVVCSLKGRFHHLCPPCVCLCACVRGVRFTSALSFHISFYLCPRVLSVCARLVVCLSRTTSLLPVDRRRGTRSVVHFNQCRITTNAIHLSISANYSPTFFPFLSPFLLYTCLCLSISSRVIHKPQTTREIEPNKNNEEQKNRTAFFIIVFLLLFFSFFFYYSLHYSAPHQHQPHHQILHCRSSLPRTQNKNKTQTICLTHLFAPVHPASSLYWTDLLDDPIPEKKTNSSW